MSRLRIGLVIGQLHRGGAEKQMTALALGLQRDHEIRPVVYCLSPLIDPHGPLLREHGIQLRVLPMRGIHKVTRPLRLRRALAQDGVDLVHSYLVGATVHGALAGLGSRRPFVSAYRNVEQYRSVVRRGVESWALNRAEVVTVNARAGIEFVHRYYRVPERRLRFIPNGIDPAEITLPERSTARRRLGIAAEAPVILGLSRLSPEKNLPLFCDVAEGALADKPDGVCLIAGDGPEMENLRHRVERATRPRMFRVLGASDEVPTLLAAADLLLLASRHEGTPNAVMEAMSASLPVVATRVGDIPELVRDGETGFVRGLADRAGLVEACRDLLGDRRAAGRLGERGRARVQSEYGMKRMVVRHAELYATLIDRVGTEPR